VPPRRQQSLINDEVFILPEIEKSEINQTEEEDLNAHFAKMLLAQTCLSHKDDCCKKMIIAPGFLSCNKSHLARMLLSLG